MERESARSRTREEEGREREERTESRDLLGDGVEVHGGFALGRDTCELKARMEEREEA